MPYKVKQAKSIVVQRVCVVGRSFGPSALMSSWCADMHFVGITYKIGPPCLGFCLANQLTCGGCGVDG